MSKIKLCDYCDNYFPEYDYGYNSEVDYCRLVGYHCFYDFSTDYDDCLFDCSDCDPKCCLGFERK